MFPDLGATCWTAMFSMPAGSHLTLAGQFPHARYLSMNSYDQNGAATSEITDVGIAADQGATNPFVAGADNTTVTGSTACKAISASKQLPPSLAFPLSVYLTLRGSGATVPAQVPPAFWREFNIGSLVGCIYQASCGGTSALTPGQYSNLDNAHTVAAVNRGFADGPVLVLHGTMPTTPKTCLGEPTMASSVDMRYWSICRYESLATTEVAGCLDDEQVPVDASGNHTIASSTSKDRPANATSACGVAWLPWPKDGDGAGHLNDGMLIMRTMLPDPSFTSAIQDVTRPGQEGPVMGSYLLTASYTTKAAFSTPSCP